MLSLAERFWAKVNKDGPVVRPELGPCWVWTAGIGAQGYGRINRGGRGAGSDNSHRISWELNCGPIPPGLHVLHRCDHRPCVRPDHLFLGTNNDNIADMVTKGRHVAANARLTPSEVIDIRSLAGLATRRALAAAFQVSKEQIRDIVLGKRWRNVA